MNDTPVSNEPVDLKETCACLRHQLNSVLILLLVVSSTITIFFLRQVTLARKDRDSIRAGVVEYQQNGIPALNEFTAKLREFAKTHPDVVPILTRYGVVQVSNTAPPTAAPAPGK
jgi:hypothetical protein